MLHLLFTGHDFKFLTPVIDFFEENPNVDVRIEKQEGHYLKEIEEAEVNLEWADVIFCEWALGNLVWYSNHKKEGQLLISRLHSQEIESVPHFLDETNWDNVDKLIVICPLNKERMFERYPKLKNGKVELIYNPIDASGVFSRERMENSCFNIGFVGSVPQRKRLDICFDIFEELKKSDSRWTLSIKGRKPLEYSWMKSRADELEWYENLFSRIENSPFRNSVIFEKFGNDMASWYSHIGFLLSTSDFEGSHQAVAEAMAAGAIPIIRNWPGADLLYPEKYTYDFEGSARDAANKIAGFMSNGDVYNAESNECRKFAIENFDNPIICKKIEDLIKIHQKYESANLPTTSNLSHMTRVMIIAYMVDDALTGYRIRVEQIIRRLSSQGIYVHLVCLHPTLSEDKLNILKKANDTIGCNYTLVESINFFSLAVSEKNIKKELQCIEQIIQDNDIEFVQAEALYCAKFLVMLKKRNSELKTVFDCHGCSPAEEVMNNASTARIQSSLLWEREVFDTVDAVIFVSHAMKKYYEEQYQITNLKNMIVPCCVDTDATKINTIQEDMAENGRVNTKCRKTIGYLGTLAVWQCADEMFEAFKVLHSIDKDIFFYMVLPSNDHEKCREYFEKAGISKEHYCVEEIPHEKVPLALAKMDAGMLLRKNSIVNVVSSPTKYGEYIDAGVPVILTDCVGDYSELTRETGLGVVLPAPDYGWTLTKEQAKSIINLMEKRAKCSEDFLRKGKDIVENKLSWNENIKSLYNYYQK